ASGPGAVLINDIDVERGIGPTLGKVTASWILNVHIPKAKRLVLFPQAGYKNVSVNTTRSNFLSVMHNCINVSQATKDTLHDFQTYPSFIIAHLGDLFHRLYASPVYNQTMSLMNLTDVFKSAVDQHPLFPLDTPHANIIDEAIRSCTDANSDR
ncbi:hypothetical protein BGX29_010107, partial [Mortierella sp. GBA35]